MAVITFRTSDGYVLHLVDGVWMNSDFNFDDDNGWPVDDTGQRLEGTYV